MPSKDSASRNWHQPTVWETEIRPLLPVTYQDEARRLGAWTRTRGIAGIDALLQALLGYVLCARSLRQLGAWATLVGLGSISDRAWSKRIRHSTSWALWLLGALVQPTSCGRPGPAQPLRIRLIDASMVRMKSHRGRSARLHCSYDLREQRLDQVVITDEHQGEGLQHFGLEAGDLIVADRCYCRATTLQRVSAAHAQVLVRWHSSNLPLTTRDGAPFDVAAWLPTLAGETADMALMAASQPLRLLACRLSPEAAKREAYRRRRKAVKGGSQVQAQTLVYAAWLLLVTSLPATDWPLADVLTLYRARWQVELLFKRIKQLLRLHGVPSGAYAAAEAFLAWSLVSWALLDRQVELVDERLPASSRWHTTALLVDAFRSMVWGHWTWTAIWSHLEELRRYLRPSRPPNQLWSVNPILSHLESVLACA
jgi:Transposase DDE domain